jgi:hypothetical protein
MFFSAFLSFTKKIKYDFQKKKKKIKYININNDKKYIVIAYYTYLNTYLLGFNTTRRLISTSLFYGYKFPLN